MGYRYLSVPINSIIDASISCRPISYVNFGRVGLIVELTKLICELLINDTAENWRI